MSLCLGVHVCEREVGACDCGLEIKMSACVCLCEREVGACDCVLEIKMSVGACDCTKVSMHACALLERLPRDMCVLVDQKSP